MNGGDGILNCAVKEVEVRVEGRGKSNQPWRREDAREAPTGLKKSSACRLQHSCVISTQTARGATHGEE